MANESRKVRRSGRPLGTGDAGDSASSSLQVSDPLAPGALKQMALRLGLILGAVWIVGGLIAAMSVSPWTLGFGLGVPAVMTIGIGAVVVWALRRAKRAQGVAGILSGVKTDEDRKAAMERLEQNYKGNDPAAIFAKAQLQMQEDPRQALRTLEQIQLSKVMASVADEARAQRGMIHLMLGEVTKARDLADGIDLSRHQDNRSKAMMGAVIAEAWARSGQASKAVGTIELFNADEAGMEQLRPQLYRAQAFVYAYANKPKSMRRALKKLVQTDARILGGFLTKKTHPLLQKEAKLLLEQSGQVPRKMQFQRS